MAYRRYRRRGGYRRYGGFRRYSRRSSGGFGGLTNPMFLLGLAAPFFTEPNETAFKAGIVAAAAPVRLGVFKKIAQGYVIGQVLENQFGNPLKR